LRDVYPFSGTAQAELRQKYSKARLKRCQLPEDICLAPEIVVDVDIEKASSDSGGQPIQRVRGNLPITSGALISNAADAVSQKLTELSTGKPTSHTLS
jgi:hypothetical protein